jgi:beta-phosphoglucomutase-like phosphatase (HAD superfamily)/dTDP-glucose pyrophosphorylase
MNKLIVFDLDGVLVDSKDTHFQALNLALEAVAPGLGITKAEQKNTYEGLPTRNKLVLLTENKGLSPELYELVWNLKQEKTAELFLQVSKDEELITFFKQIKDKGVKVAVASNSIAATVNPCLEQLGVLPYIDLVLCNEDVTNVKPHPEIYWKAMTAFHTTSSNTVIFEDSFVGKTAARESNACLIEVENRADLTSGKITGALHHLFKSPLTVDKTLNVLIPMAGAGSRFAEAGYNFPKPLIDVNGKPMIQAVVESLGIKANYIYVAKDEDIDKYNLTWMLNNITPGCLVIGTSGLTQGAAESCLSAHEFIDNDNPLVIANSDQIIEWDSRQFLYDLHMKNADGGIATFTSNHPKWSYARVAADSGLVVEVAEKKPISNLATVGVYYWKHGSDFVKYGNQMIEKDIRVNGEFYTCPIFNEAIEDGKKIYTLPVEKMWGVGTPEDLNNYLRNHSD